MATDGVKIIDGDLAHDIHETFMEMYDAGASVEEIKKAVEEPFDAEDGFDYEIYITVFALALWQTGQLTPDTLQEVDGAIFRGAGVKVWTEEIDSREGQKRQRELEKLREKLVQPNPKIRKRRVYKQITKFVFEENAVLAFQLPDGKYGAAILMQIYQYQRRCYYHFIASTFIGINNPTLDEVKDGRILGRRIPSGYGSHTIGLDTVMVGPKQLRSFANGFRQIGQIEIRPESKHLGACRGCQDFESFCQNWLNQEIQLKNLSGTTIPLKELM